MRRRPTTGFTLFELLIVISIILALGAIVSVSFMTAGDQADVGRLRAQLRQQQLAERLQRQHPAPVPAPAAPVGTDAAPPPPTPAQLPPVPPTVRMIVPL